MLVCLGKGLEAGVLYACVEFRLPHESIPVLWPCSCCTVDLSRFTTAVDHYGHFRYPLNQHGAILFFPCSKNFIYPRLSFAIIKPAYSVHPILSSPSTIAAPRTRSCSVKSPIPFTPSQVSTISTILLMLS